MAQARAARKRERIGHGVNEAMAKKKKLKKFRAVTAVKELARERVGQVPTTKVVPNKSERGAKKHKPTLGRLLAEE
jgi:hypothetical protein